MLPTNIEELNPNSVDVRFWLKEMVNQMADVNGNLYAIRQMITAAFPDKEVAEAKKEKQIASGS